ncbi:MAG TPA: tetratricopeptide repeat protein [Vicinamibacterales bacterium]|nr:tetratricopeptide repeat protein [Vicinamibacterales bacterium]
MMSFKISLLSGMSAALVCAVLPSAASAQKPEVQRLFQSGSFEKAVEAARDGDAASTYLAAQSLLKMEQPDRAGAELARLRGSDEPAWRMIAESGEALIANDAGRAVELARRAIESDGGNPFAHYQLGLAASRANDWGSAVTGFTKAIENKPDFAYAHYYAGLAYQRQRQLPKTAEHFDAFLRLAPDAPERSAVSAILRTIK